jgi:hypothetical protein
LPKNEIEKSRNLSSPLPVIQNLFPALTLTASKSFVCTLVSGGNSNNLSSTLNSHDNLEYNLPKNKSEKSRNLSPHSVIQNLFPALSQPPKASSVHLSPGEMQTTFLPLSTHMNNQVLVTFYILKTIYHFLPSEDSVQYTVVDDTAVLYTLTNTSSVQKGIQKDKSIVGMLS